MQPWSVTTARTRDYPAASELLTAQHGFNNDSDERLLNDNSESQTEVVSP